MKFTKMHGLGNDYIFVEADDVRDQDNAALARQMSDRNTGVGSDGLILLDSASNADLRIVIFNADGSQRASRRMCVVCLR